jgi:hypothetical protein
MVTGYCLLVLVTDVTIILKLLLSYYIFKNYSFLLTSFILAIVLPIIKILMIYTQIRWVPCHHGMARPQVVDGGDSLQIWRVAANILNKQPRTADKGWASILGVGRGANNSSP